MIAAAISAVTSLFSTKDEQAMWRVAMQDDGQAFAQLVRRWEDPIRRLAERMTGDSHRAEDLAQEAFARVYARRKDYQPASRFSTWLWRIALNLCHDDLRRRCRRAEVPLEDEFSDPGSGIHAFTSDAPSPDTSLVENERHALVRNALQQLPESFRAVVVLKHYEGLKFREIAEILDIPEGTVKSRMAQSLNQLQRHLAPSLTEPAARRRPGAHRQAPTENFVL